MFGGQDNNATVPSADATSTPQSDPLQGVANMIGGSTPPATTIPVSSQSGTFLPSPSDAPQVGAPTLPDSGAGGDLLGIKQQALQQLTPLVSHLEQTPLEKFRTTMMLIQASDNQALLKDAYEAAQKIDDDKIRAQALLDVINEINYFTQPKDQAKY